MPHPIPIRTFSEPDRARLLDALYLAPATEGGWLETLKQVVHWTGSRSARLLVLNREADQVRSSLQVNTDGKAHQAYVEHFVNLCPWRTELGDKPAGQLYSTFLDFSCDQKTFYRSEFFNDWARPLDIHHGACGTVLESGDTKVQLLIQRTEGQNHYQRQEMTRLNELMPHLRRALMLDQQHWLRAQELDARGLARRSSPVALFNAQGKIVFLSEGVQALLQRHRSLRLAPGGLRFQDHFTQERFNALLTDAMESCQRGWHSPGGMLEVPDSHRSGLRLLVSPIHPDLPRHTLFPFQAFAAVFFIDPAAITEVPGDWMMNLYGLTEAEARVAARVARGDDMKQIATDLTLSVHTVRTQLKAVYRKTGVQRQAQLANLLLQTLHSSGTV